MVSVNGVVHVKYPPSVLKVGRWAATAACLGSVARSELEMVLYMGVQRVQCVVLRFMGNYFCRSCLQQRITGAEATEKAKCKGSARVLSEADEGYAAGCYQFEKRLLT